MALPMIHLWTKEWSSQVLDKVSSLQYTPLLILLLKLFAAYYVGTAIYNIYLHPLSKFPGPKFRAISEWPYILSLMGGRAPQDMVKLHLRYGPIVRVAPNELTFVRPKAFRDIYGFRKGREELRKDRRYFKGMNEPTLLDCPDYTQHMKLRKMLAPGFSDASLRRQEAVIQEYLDILIQKLEEKSELDEEVDLVKWLNFFVFDVIGLLTYGQTFDCLNTTALHRWIELIPPLGKFFAYYNALERVPRLVKLAFLAILAPKNLISDAREIGQIGQKRVTDRLKSSPQVPDLMEKLIDEYKAGKMTRKQLNSNATFLVTAGSETLVTALTHCIFQLLTNRHALQKLEHEIRTTFKTPKEINMITVNKCKYLEAVIEETLRNLAPSPATHPRYTPPEGIDIDGIWIPGDTAVGVPILCACKSPLNFTNPNKFVPERWTGEDPLYHGDARDAAQIFSLGPRDCIGRNLAYVEMRLVLARLIWHFDFEKRFPERWNEQQVYLVWVKPPMMVKVKKAMR